MLKLQNVISRKSVPAFQKQMFADLLQKEGVLKSYAIVLPYETFLGGGGGGAAK